MHVNLARYLVGRGHDVHVFGNARDSDAALLHEARFHDVGLSIKSGRIAEPATALRFMRRAQAMIDAERFDAVHGRGVSLWQQDIVHLTGLYRMERSALREAHGERGLIYTIKDRVQPLVYPMGTLRSLVERRLAADRRLLIHAETSGVKDALVATYGVDPQRVRVVVPGVDIDTFAPDGPRVDLNLPEPIIGFFGHDYRRKGLDILLRAIPRMTKSASLVVIGGGGHLEQEWTDAAVEPYVRLSGELGLSERVRFVGATRDAAPYLRSAAVLAHPARFDVWALAVGEAMGAGLPVVVSPTTGASELVDDRVGHVLGDDFDADELAAALDEILEPARRERAAAAARAAAEQVSVEHQGALVEEDMLRVAREKAERREGRLPIASR